MKRILFLFAFLGLTIISCRKDEEVGTQQTLITFIDIPQSYYEEYIVISGLEGELLKTVKLSELKSEPVYSDLQYKKDRINITKISKNLDGGKISFMHGCSPILKKVENVPFRG